MTGKCNCCERTRDLRMDVCFDCAEAESVILDGTDMYDNPIKKIDGMSDSMSRLKSVLNIFKITPPH